MQFQGGVTTAHKAEDMLMYGNWLHSMCPELIDHQMKRRKVQAENSTSMIVFVMKHKAMGTGQKDC